MKKLNLQKEKNISFLPGRDEPIFSFFDSPFRKEGRSLHPLFEALRYI